MLNAEDYQQVPVLQGNPDSAANPTINEVQSTPLGYVISGTGFGSDATAVQVLESGVKLSESAIAGVSTQRISVLSIPDTTTTIAVNVGGIESAPFPFQYVKPAQPPVPEMPFEDDSVTTEVQLPEADSPENNSPAASDAETPIAAADLSEDSNLETNSSVDSMPKQDVATSGVNDNFQPDDLGREVQVLRRRLEALEQEIYELRKAVSDQ